MAPNVHEDEIFDNHEELQKRVTVAEPRKFEIVYKNILIFGYMHVAALYGGYLCFTSAKWTTIIFTYLLHVMASIGVTAGAHRLWSHKSYKATPLLETILMVFLSIANQKATNWVRDHRLHHKYSDTDADPHNASRGFFYSHIGWVFVKKHSEVKSKGRFTYLDDIHNNPILKFQHRHATIFITTISIILPTLIPIFCWGESLRNAWHLVMLRHIVSSHLFFLVNSAAHLYGTKPYDKSIMSVENSITSFFTFGEGFHNFHHVFPWDYRSAELGFNKINFATIFIDFCARIGLAYDLKVVSEDMIQSRKKRTGDISESLINN